jgi:triosephosphate isomerase
MRQAQPMADAGRGRTAWGEAARPFVVGNWKMWGPRAALAEIDGIAAAARAHPEVDVALCLPATLIEAARARAPDLAIGGQDCHAEAEGAFTGSVSAGLLREAGASLALLGHSERRRLCGERDADVRDKLRAARAAGLTAIVCVGEPAEARAHAADYVRQQLIEMLEDAAPEGLTIAYEPIWAIGIGRAADARAIATIHSAIRGCLQALFGEHHRQIGILYGGSVDPDNVAAVLTASEVAGVLVGSASRSARTFAAIIASTLARQPGFQHGCSRGRSDEQLYLQRNSRRLF